MTMSTNTLATIVAKVFHTNSQQRPQGEQKALEDLAKDAVVTPYIEEEPSVREWIWSLRPTRQGFVQYVGSLFPFASWITRYNMHWMLGDAIAGLTVGFVVVPQAMAYALLANLSPEFGLYTSFVGAALYWLFGTSKDITTAVGSLLVGSVINTVEHKNPGLYTREEIAKGLSFLSGLILIFLGLFRLGWLIELIPYVPISAFVTSASFTIIGTQLPVALGIAGIKTREAPYKVYINVLKGLPRTQVDAAIGLTSIVLLSILRHVFAKMEVRQPGKKRLWATLSSLRLTFAILLYTFISWIVHRRLPRGDHKFRLVGEIESGFKHAGVPKISTELFGLVAPSLPAIIIILIIEHIAIAKSFGRKFGYTVIPSQEILAQGAANMLGTFLGGYTCTGSFGASAVLTKAGVRTPLAGLFSAMILVLALYALTAVFYYIPMAALAGLIIHAVANLMTPPSALYKYWRLAPFELLIWVVGVTVALFVSLETSIYATIALSFALLLVRMARSQGGFLGQVKIHRVVHRTDKDETNSQSSGSGINEKEREKEREVYLPLEKKENPNPRIDVVAPYPGIFIYRFNEAFNYVNKAQHLDHLLSYVTAHTRRTRSDDGVPLKDRLWSDPIPPPPNSPSSTPSSLPLLRAIVLDCSTINNLDITSIQGLIDVRNTLDRYAAPAIVEWHFAGLQNRWARRALAVAGFGYPVVEGSDLPGNWCPAYSVASSLAGATEEDRRVTRARERKAKGQDEERRWEGMEKSDGDGDVNEKKRVMEPVHGVDRPFFHIDLVDAVDTAIRDAMKRDEEG
ncbi:sulfate permease [Lepidopterella palustris CBS 459.81]|uniref:Sulfate permease n=1 Tax=Lepidopterella palustris CBS 459.81 TaxID=1314670 RepID=A0A8E2J8K7_9PEZI|nr:sulfate permease [Lepidopterella palustris CBS 459.81]